MEGIQIQILGVEMSGPRCDRFGSSSDQFRSAFDEFRIVRRRCRSQHGETTAISFSFVDGLDARGRANSVPPRACYVPNFVYISLGHGDERSRLVARSDPNNSETDPNNSPNRSEQQSKSGQQRIRIQTIFPNPNDISESKQHFPNRNNNDESFQKLLDDDVIIGLFSTNPTRLLFRFLFRFLLPFVNSCLYSYIHCIH